MNDQTGLTAAERDGIQALARISSHEQECGRRYSEFASAMTDLRRRVDAMNRINIGLLLTVLAVLLGAIVQMATTGRH